MKRSRRQRKISKVMGEFKDGSLKSGGSGRKVTNPKQAIAIALSEAEGMNQGGIVGLAQMGSPFTNSIRQPSRNQSQRFDQTMGPRPISPMQQRGFQGPQQMGPMQRNFMQLQNQMQGMQQNPLELYQGYLGQKYIGPMQQEQQNKISQFVGAVSQAERQAFGGQQGGKTFGGRLQPGMPGLGLKNEGGPQPSFLQPTNQAPDVMPPMNQSPGIMPPMNQAPALMNQGGMMYSDIMNRPMFQTPQQRQGMGIMAGVAPVRGYKDGGEAEEDSIGRMVFEALVVDPDDPIDVGIATASAAMMAGGITAPGAIAAQLARMGYKGKKLFDAIKKVERLGKSNKENAGVVRQAMAPVVATYGASQTPRNILEAPEIIEAGGGIGDLIRDSVMGRSVDTEAMAQQMPSESSSVSVEDVINMPSVYDMTQGYANGGVASLPVIEMRLGGEVIKGIFDFVTTYGSKGLEALGEGVKRQLSKGQADQLVDQAKKADKVLGEAGAETVEQGQRLVLKKPDGELIETPIGKVPKPPEPPVTPKVADDATEAATEAAKKAAKKPITQRVRQSVPGQVVSGALKPITSPIRVGAPVAAGAYALNQLIESGKIQEAIDMAMNDPTVKSLIDAGKPAYEAVTEFFGPIGDALFPDTGERVELTESAQARLPEVEKARKEGFPELPTDAKKDDGTGTSAPEATGIMKFLFGKDGIGGDPGAVGKTMDYLADPRTRYALARAAESRPGVVDRNFFTDFTLGQAEYDQLQGKDETALMQNYEFLKAAGKSDDEIFDLLLSKDTESDRRRQLEEDTLTLFNTLKKDDVSNTDRSVLYEEARRMALRNQGLIPPAEPQDAEVVTVDLE